MTVPEFNRCVDDFSDGVYRFILKNIRDEMLAMDIVQDSFEKMWMKFREISFEKAKSYLFTIAYHALVDHIRKQKHQSDWDEQIEEMHSTEKEYSGLNEILDKALQQLPEIQRHLVLLRDYEGYSYREIGEITGLSEAQVKVYIFRARMFLKSYIVKLENVI